MFDVGANLFNALPQSYGIGNRSVASGFSLNKPDESLASGNSLRAVTAAYREDSGLPDFSEKPKNEQGFLSLGPVLDSLRPAPPPIASPLSDEPTTWEKLLEEQKRISEAQSERQKQTREFLDAQQSTNNEVAQLAESNRERVVLEFDNSEDIPSPDQSSEEDTAIRAAQLALNAQRNASQETEPVVDNSEPEQEPVDFAPLPGQGERIDSPFQSEEAFSSPPVFGQSGPDATEAPNQDLQRLQQSYGTSFAGGNAGGNVDIFI